MINCRICNNAHGNRVHTAKEMMYGTRDEFDYLECGECGCVQAAEIPYDMSEYYPENYYSLTLERENFFLRLLKRRRATQAMGGDTVIGRLLVQIWGIPPILEWLRPVGITQDSSILDVGTGAGQLLLDMNNIGFSDTLGIDPFLDHDLNYGSGTRILKKELSEITGVFDLIMFHHSFEHMPDPLDALGDANRLVPLGGKVLIRIPIAGTYAWKTFRTDWVQLDAPRHLFLHTNKSMEILAAECGFKIEHIVHDSSAFQFWGSIQYQRGIPLKDERSYGLNPKQPIFSRAEIDEFEKKAIELNQLQDGDQACFYLRKTKSA